MDRGLSDCELIEHSDRDEWLNGRTASIGSSDAAVILGYGYASQSKYSLWAEKRHGFTPEFKESTLKMFAKGQAAEPYIAQLCKIDYRWEVQFDPENSYRRSRINPHWTASLDGWMVEDGQHVALEFKNISPWAGRDWDVKSGRAPLRYTLQLQHQMLVTGWKKGYLCSIEGHDLKKIEVPRHDDLIESLKLEYASFWQNVEQGIEPEIDHTDPTRRAVESVYPPRPVSAEYLDNDTSALVTRMMELEAAIEANSKEVEMLRNQLVSATKGSNLIVTTDGQWFSFKSTRGGKRRLKLKKGKIRL